jgi:hypothetical protein
MKQVDFAVHVATLNGGGLNGGMTSAGFTEWIKQLHPLDKGWRVDSINVVQVSADGISVAALVTQWTDDTVSNKAK